MVGIANTKKILERKVHLKSQPRGGNYVTKRKELDQPERHSVKEGWDEILHYGEASCLKPGRLICISYIFESVI
jgi:hypothetical protein